MIIDDDDDGVDGVDDDVKLQCLGDWGEYTK